MFQVQLRNANYLKDPLRKYYEKLMKFSVSATDGLSSIKLIFNSLPHFQRISRSILHRPL
jgi:hypothetical protein